MRENERTREIKIEIERQRYREIDYRWIEIE